ncbi:hypothetical protein, partial [Segetibacter sp. 3557_3]|uniref:hypothetical protein n=1 Tax=Segetibacter sp. 3557_3 TaxID=2547429 RepID=UPI001A9E419C
LCHRVSVFKVIDYSLTQFTLLQDPFLFTSLPHLIHETLYCISSRSRVNCTMGYTKHQELNFPCYLFITAAILAKTRDHISSRSHCIGFVPEQDGPAFPHW